MSIPAAKFQELLAKARKLSQESKDADTRAATTAINNLVNTVRDRAVDTVDLTLMGITPESLGTREGEEAAVDAILEVHSLAPETVIVSESPIVSAGNTLHTKRDAGVARDVTLNDKQAEFIELAMEGEDVVLIGAAGTGKTTVTGKLVSRLIETSQLTPLGTDTKWLHNDVPGVLITSFTRKAVNNIKRAVPSALKPHVLTMHKVLEFQPEFYQVPDPSNPLGFRNTMRFEPTRTAFNPLPKALSLVIYEESSMIGTGLYDLMMAAMPHAPQEIFIGDIRQLPPVFGPAILGFKMSLLPVIELTEVYRQALLSPIIRLAHTILSGDSTKFDPQTELNAAKKKIVPTLEAFSEDTEHGSVKFQVWQKKLSPENACNTTVMQFNHWESTGYYKPNDDIILCPFNKSFGTVDLNKGIANHLGLKRGAVVHEVIAGYNKYYLAIGDRILYDKEDAFIIDIRRNLSYMGVNPQPASVHLDRYGAQQIRLSEEEQQRLAEEDADYSEAAMDKFLENFGEDEERTTVASHVIDIEYAYSEDRETLSSAGQVNNILGGYAITVHKAQGSEADSVFLALHHSHAAMVSNELLYTAVTRAKKKLHIICEIDTFFKGVKSQKVRGITLEEKIETFKGKVDYKKMLEELEASKRFKELKKERLKTEKAHRQQQRDWIDAEWKEVNKTRERNEPRYVKSERVYPMLEDSGNIRHDIMDDDGSPPYEPNMDHAERVAIQAARKETLERKRAQAVVSAPEIPIVSKADTQTKADTKPAAVVSDSTRAAILKLMAAAKQKRR